MPQFEMNSVRILKDLGYEVHYASNFTNPIYKLDKDELTAMGIHLHQIDVQKSPLRFIKNAKALFQTLKIMRKEKITVCHFHNPMGGVIGRVAALLNRNVKYTIYTAHGFHFYKGAPIENWLLYFPIEFLLGKKTDCLITINKEDFDCANIIGRRKNKKIIQIPGVGVETARFKQPQGLRERVRKQHNIDDDVFYILSVGELNSNKNHEVILNAMTILRREKIHFGICGAGPNEAYLLELAAKLGLSDCFTLFGYKDNIPEMLGLADCFAFPSKREGLGIAAIEAMAAGIPLITSDCRGTREYMTDDITGYVSRNGTPREYATLIMKMLMFPEKREQMAKACQLRAKDFDKERTYGIIKNVYSNIKIAAKNQR
ncbi:MAG: glycosyltransferase [Lachnospiraceae bacterium]|nr:glycosyltransferase [Lachnospiraceae bacterium]